MARFNFGKRTPDDEGVPPEPIEGETEAGDLPELVVSGNRMPRWAIFALIGVLLVGGAYLANVLFFSAPPPPAIPSRPVAPVPPAPAPAPAPQAKTAAPAPPAAVSKLPEATKAEPKSAPPQPLAPSKAAPSKTAPSVTTPPPPAPASKASPAPAGKPAPAPVAKAEKPVSVKGAPSVAKGFSIQIGAMAQAANAENLKRKLDEMGFQAVVRKGSGFANRHVVTVGDPAGKREAEDLTRRLNVEGFPSQLITVEGKYTPQVGTFVNLDEAIDLARDLQKKNFRPKITSKPATTVLYQVRHGQFETRAAAMKRGEELKAKGFSAWVVPN